jgi:hypothetical protein
MSLFRCGDVWWYEFWFAGRRIQESSKSPSKTIARTAMAIGCASPTRPYLPIMESTT